MEGGGGAGVFEEDGRRVEDIEEERREELEAEGGRRGRRREEGVELEVERFEEEEDGERGGGRGGGEGEAGDEEDRTERRGEEGGELDRDAVIEAGERRSGPPLAGEKSEEREWGAGWLSNWRTDWEGGRPTREEQGSSPWVVRCLSSPSASLFHSEKEEEGIKNQSQSPKPIPPKHTNQYYCQDFSKNDGEFW